MNRAASGLFSLVLLVASALAPVPARADDRVALAISPQQANLGDKVIVRLDGWTTTAVTLNICGNLGLRGAPDCDLIHGQGVGLARGGPTLAEMLITAPPVSCPCILRASSVTNDEVQTAPVVIVGAPVGPVRQPGAPAALVTVTARQAEVRQGLLGTLRPLLGGRRRHLVTITLENISTVTLSKVSLGLIAGQAIGGAEPVPVPAVEPLKPGEVRTYGVQVTRSAPAWGRYRWEVTVDGAGPEVRTTVGASASPWLLYVLLAALVADVGALAVRKLGRRRRPRTAGPGRRACSGRSRRPSQSGNGRHHGPDAPRHAVPAGPVNRPPPDPGAAPGALVACRPPCGPVGETGPGWPPAIRARRRRQPPGFAWRSRRAPRPDTRRQSAAEILAW